MNLPPAILDLRVSSPERSHPVHVWLPLFLLWPLFLAVAVLTLVLTILADFVLVVLRERYHHYTILLVRSMAALFETRGMVIRVRSDTSAVDLTVQ